jgi:glutathione S-transferase
MTARDTFDLTLTRTIRAPRAKVFDAFVNPDQLRKWFGPRNHNVAEATVDAKIGGRYRLVMQPMAGKTFAVGGVYREIASPSRLVFTWKWEGEEMGAMGETLVTVTLDERRGEHGVETEVRLQHSGFPAPEARTAHNDGWGSTLNRLVDMVHPRGSAATVTASAPAQHLCTIRTHGARRKGGRVFARTVVPHSVEIRHSILSGACRHSATANSRSTKHPRSFAISRNPSPAPRCWQAMPACARRWSNG